MSGKKLSLFIFVAALLLLAGMFSAVAYSEDFNAYALNKELYVCACSGTENKIAVENTGDVASVYGLTQEGDAAVFSSLSPNTFGLKPGESETVHNFITAPCNIEGKYSLKTIVDTTFGSSKELEQTVDVRKCVNVDVMQTKAPESVCPCSPVRYDFMIKNTGDFVETYVMNVTPYAEYVSISENVVILGPGESKTVYVFVTTPCGFFGDIGLNLVVDAQRSGMRAELPFTLSINACYDYGITSADEFYVCADVGNVVPVVVSNNAEVSNSYVLSTDTPWAFFDNGFIGLGKKQNTQLNLTIYPSSVPAGLYNMTLKSVSERGELVVEKNVKVQVDTCHSLNLTAESAPIFTNCEKGTVKAYLKNDGVRESTYSLSLYGESWAELSAGSVSVKPGQEMAVPIIINAPCNETGTYDFTLITNITNFPERLNQVSFQLEVQSPEDSYRIEISGADDTISVNYNGAVVPLTITNSGIKDSNYNLVLNTDQNWIYLNQTKIYVPAGESVVVDLVIVPSNDSQIGSYEIAVDAIPEGKDLVYERAFTIELREKTFAETILGLWPYLLSSAILIATLVIFLIVLLSRKKQKKADEEFWSSVEGKPSSIEKEEPLLDVEKKERGWLKWLLFGIVLLLLIGAVVGGWYLYSYYHAQGNETNATEEIVEEVEPVVEENLTEEAQPGLFSRIKTWIFGDGNATEEVVEEVEEPAPQESIEDATIYVDKSGLEGQGNVIEARKLENTTIPLVIQNNYEPNTFIIRVNKDVDWIAVDKNVIEIPPNEKGTIYLTVVPDESTEEGDYKIDINIDIEGKFNPIKEEIILSVVQKEPFYMQYLWYLVAGVAAFMLILAILGIMRYAKKRKEAPFEEIAKEEKAKRSRKEDKAMHAAEPAYEEEKGSWLKIMGIGILVIILLAAAIYGLIYFGKGFMPSNENVTEEIVEGAADQLEPDNAALEDVQGSSVVDQNITYENILVKKGTETIVPIRIKNANETAIFSIKVNEDISWITIDKSEVVVEPNGNNTISLIVNPDETVEDGDYRVTVNIDVLNQQKEFSQGFVLQVRKSEYSALWSYLLYALAGILVLCIVLFILRRKDKEMEGSFEDNSNSKEIEQEPSFKKTNITLE